MENPLAKPGVRHPDVLVHHDTTDLFSKFVMEFCLWLIDEGAEHAMIREPRARPVRVEIEDAEMTIADVKKRLGM